MQVFDMTLHAYPAEVPVIA